MHRTVSSRPLEVHLHKMLSRRWLRQLGGWVAIGALASCSAPSGASSPSIGASPSAHPFADETAWMAYQTNKGGGEGVWLIHPDGSDDHEVAASVPGEHIHPDWSPDGARLVLTSRERTDTLYELDVETDRARVLWKCADPCVGDDEAVWSPDGSRIAFVRAMEPIENNIPTCALMVGDPRSGRVEELSKKKSCLDRETFPRWSHDGGRIAYYRGVYETGGATTNSTALYVLDVGSQRETKLTEDGLFAGDSDWSKDDDWLVFSTHPLNDFQCCEISNLYRIRPDGRGLEQLTHEASDAIRLTQPRFTPDATRLVVTVVTSSARELQILPPDGSGEPIVVRSGGIYTHGTWQPAGEG